MLKERDYLKRRLHSSKNSGKYYYLSENLDSCLNCARYCPVIEIAGTVYELKIYDRFWKSLSDSEGTEIIRVPGNGLQDFIEVELPFPVLLQLELKGLVSSYPRTLKEGAGILITGKYSFRGATQEYWHRLEAIYLVDKGFISPHQQRERLFRAIVDALGDDYSTRKQGRLDIREYNLYALPTYLKPWMNKGDYIWLYNHLIVPDKGIIYYLKVDNSMILYSENTLQVKSFDHEEKILGPGAYFLSHPVPNDGTID